LSWEKREKRVLLPLTSQDFLCGSNDNPRNPSFFLPENDLVRRSSGKNELELGLARNAGILSAFLVGLKRDLIMAEEVDLRAEEDAAEDW